MKNLFGVETQLRLWDRNKCAWHKDAGEDRWSEWAAVQRQFSKLSRTDTAKLLHRVSTGGEYKHFVVP